jgi:serine/threonine protein kinase
MPFETNQRVGDYEILGLLGAGGMGHVYRARNIISDRTEAMKVLLPDLTADRDVAVRFIAEIRTLAGFDHPNIALLHTAFQMDNQLIMVMEYVEGYTLEQRAKQGPMPIPDVVEYILQALSALGYAHQRNVVHRDIKPANLMITSHGVIKLMDFGIAKSAIDANLTRPGTTIGSLYYMSPEQVRGSTIDARSDLYSTGIVLYELLAGRRPFEADSTYGVLNQQLNTPPQPPIEINPNLPPQLNAIILKALAKDPGERFQTAEEFRTELKKFSGKVTEAAPAPIATPAAPVAEVAAAAAAPLAASSAFAAQPPAWEPVQPQPPQPLQQQPAPHLPRPGTPQPMPPIPTGGGHKTLWIATGALAAMLALVAVAIGIPRLFKARASESTTTTSVIADANTTPTAPPPTEPSVSTPPASIPAVSSPPAATPSTNPAVIHTPASVTIPAPKPHTPVATSDQPSSAPSAPAGPSAVELEQMQERYIQLDARAQAALRGVAQLRQQQEASGLGLRSDMEAADARLRSYMQAANQDVHASRVAQGSRDMDKAETEVSTLEKFLGH